MGGWIGIDGVFMSCDYTVLLLVSFVFFDTFSFPHQMMWWVRHTLLHSSIAVFKKVIDEMSECICKL